MGMLGENHCGLWADICEALVLIITALLTVATIELMPVASEGTAAVAAEVMIKVAKDIGKEVIMETIIVPACQNIFNPFIPIAMSIAGQHTTLADPHEQEEEIKECGVEMCAVAFEVMVSTAGATIVPMLGWIVGQFICGAGCTDNPFAIVDACKFDKDAPPPPSPPPPPSNPPPPSPPVFYKWDVHSEYLTWGGLALTHVMNVRGKSAADGTRRALIAGTVADDRILGVPGMEDCTCFSTPICGNVIALDSKDGTRLNEQATPWAYPTGPNGSPQCPYSQRKPQVAPDGVPPISDGLLELSYVDASVEKLLVVNDDKVDLQMLVVGTTVTKYDESTKRWATGGSQLRVFQFDKDGEHPYSILQTGNKEVLQLPGRLEQLEYRYDAQCDDSPCVYAVTRLTDEIPDVYQTGHGRPSELSTLPVVVHLVTLYDMKIWKEYKAPVPYVSLVAPSRMIDGQPDPYFYQHTPGGLMKRHVETGMVEWGGDVHLAWGSDQDPYTQNEEMKRKGISASPVPINASHLALVFIKRPVVTLDGKLVFSMTATGNVVAFDAVSGCHRWTSDSLLDHKMGYLPGDFGKPFRWAYQYGAAMPTVTPDNKLLIVPNGEGELRALDVETGELMWKLGYQDDYWTEPVFDVGEYPYKSWNGKMYIIAAGTGTIFAAKLNNDKKTMCTMYQAPLFQPGEGAEVDFEKATKPHLAPEGDQLFYQVAVNRLLAFNVKVGPVEEGGLTDACADVPNVSIP